MVEEKTQTSFFSEALAAYRDIAIAKRQQPKLVQGSQHIQVPIGQNISAPQQPVGINGAGSFINSPLFPKVLLFGGLGLLVLALTIKKVTG